MVKISSVESVFVTVTIKLTKLITTSIELDPTSRNQLNWEHQRGNTNQPELQVLF